MRHLILATVSVFAVTASASLANAAECEIGKEASFTKSDEAVASNAVRRDLRSLRKAAMSLRDLGRTSECQEVVQWIKDIRGDQKAERTRAENRAKMSGDKTAMERVERDEKKTYQERAKERMANAKPLTDMKGRVSAADLMGVDLIGPDNETAGEIEDIYVSADGKKSYAVVGFGGFLGLGESLVAVPFGKIKVSMDADGDAKYYIPMTTDQLSTAPKFKRDDRTWLTSSEWQAKNDKWFDGQ